MIKRKIMKFGAVLFLGTSIIQKPAIIAAKKRKLKIVGIDKNKYASARYLCDFFFNLDSNNTSQIYNKVKSLKNLIIKAVWANNDVLIFSRIKLENKFNIRTERTSYKNAKVVIDKKKLKKKISNSPLFIPHFSKFQKEFPVIVKPIVGGGSKGVKIIKNQKDYDKIRNKKLLIEKYLSGPEYGGNCFVTQKKIFHLPGVKRFFDHEKTMAPIGTIVTPKKNYKLKYAYQLLEKIIKQLNLFGPVKYDLLFHKSEPKLIEMSPRFHGEIDTSYVFKYLDFSLCDFYFDFLEEKNISIYKNKNNFLFYGYCSIYNKRTKLKDVYKNFKKLKLKLVQIVKRDNYIPRKYNFPGSTKDIVYYAFFKSTKDISIKDFRNLSRHINKW